MLKRLKELNTGIEFLDIYSDEFSKYGRLIENINPEELISLAERIEYPPLGSSYLPSVEALEATEAKRKIEEEIFGTLDAQIGYCFGYSRELSATEWHSSSELNIAVTPLVLILGKRSDIKNGRLDSSTMKAFYVPKGAVIEVYATSLHFCPCQTSDAGFGCIVGLPRGTNTPLDKPSSDKLLFRKNKWIIAHEENENLISRGVIPGIYGKNYKINY